MIRELLPNINRRRYARFRLSCRLPNSGRPPAQSLLPVLRGRIALNRVSRDENQQPAKNKPDCSHNIYLSSSSGRTPSSLFPTTSVGAAALVRVAGVCRITARHARNLFSWTATKGMECGKRNRLRKARSRSRIVSGRSFPLARAKASLVGRLSSPRASFLHFQPGKLCYATYHGCQSQVASAGRRRKRHQFPPSPDLSFHRDRPYGHAGSLRLDERIGLLHARPMVGDRSRL